MHGVGDVECALIAGPEDRNEHRGLHVETGHLVRLGEPVDDGGHVTQMQPASVRSGPDDEFFEFVASIGLADRAQQNLSAIRSHGAAREIQR